MAREFRFWVISGLFLGYFWALPVHAATPAGTVIENTAEILFDDTSMTTNATSITVAQVGGVNLEAASTQVTARPGTTVRLFFLLTNTGNAPDSYQVTATGTRGWTLVWTDYVGVLAMGEQRTVEVQVVVPLLARNNAVDTVTVQATSLFDSAAASATTQVRVRRRF